MRRTQRQEFEHSIKRSEFLTVAIRDRQRRQESKVADIISRTLNIPKCGKSILQFFSTPVSITDLTVLMLYF